MKKVAIVGVEGSGKTVMLAGLGELYLHADAQGYFLSPNDFRTSSYVADKIHDMRRGRWPQATAGDVMQTLNWTLRCKRSENDEPVDVGQVTCMDFAGEVYRSAFGMDSDIGTRHTEEVEALQRFISQADDLVVLINLRDIIAFGYTDDRLQEARWITKSILSYALDRAGGRRPRAAIVLSQADSYQAEIVQCGGAKGVLREYLPDVYNNYSRLDIFAANAVDATDADAEGNPVPRRDFSLNGLQCVMDWILADMGSSAPRSGSRANDCRSYADRPRRPRSDTVPPPRRPPRQPPPEEEQPTRLVEEDRGLWGYYFGCCLVKAFCFDGRARRKEFWSFCLGNFLVMVLLGWLHWSSLATAYMLASFFPGLSVTVRRLHDRDMSGWWWLIALIPPVGWLALFIIFCLPGTSGSNRYGFDPRWKEA